MKQTLSLALLILLGIGMFIFVRSKDRADGKNSTSKVDAIVLKGATQFGEQHAFSRTLRKFEQLVKQYYDEPVEFELYLNSELGLEKDYFAYMSQGISVDYGIVSPSHMSTFSTMAPLMDVPFLFRDVEHWTKVLDSDAFDPIGSEIAAKADVMVIGHAGGGVRNLIVKRPVTDIRELNGLTIRVMGAPIQTQMFQALGASPTVIAYSEVYNAMQTGVIDAAENEAAGTEQMKFYEVGPEICLTQHAITVRPFCFSGKTFRRLPEKLQQAILRAGREAAAYGRQLESTEDSATLARLQQAGKLRLHRFASRSELLRLADPVKIAYAKQIGATEVLDRVNSVK